MNISFSDLKEINCKIKASATREEGYLELLGIDPEKLNPGLAMYHAYLKGKYYGLCYEEDKELSYLEWANDQYDEIVTIAWKHGVKPKNPKYLFKRAYTKFLLSKVLVQKASRKYFHQKACQLTEAGLRYHASNPSFHWLKSEL